MFDTLYIIIFFLLAHPTYPQQPGYVGPTPPYGMPTGQFDGQPNMANPYSPQGLYFKTSFIFDHF